MKRKRWLVLLILLLMVMIAGFLWRRTSAAAKNKREMGYHLALIKYSEGFQTGLTRKEVEDRLRSTGTGFQRIWTAFGGRRESNYGDLVKIGEGKPPWYCSEAYVYIALEFSAIEEHDLLHHLSRDSDVLERVEIFRPLSGCL